MTDITYIKNFKNEIENSTNQLTKLCFNPHCNKRVTKRVYIVGTDADFRDHRIPFWVCEEHFSPFIGWGPGIDHNESLKSIPESKVCYDRSCSNKGEYWIDVYKKEIATLHHPDDGWSGDTVAYWLCESCYAYFEDKRKDFLSLCKKIFYRRIEFDTLREEDRTAITVEDFCELLESSKSSQEMTEVNRSDEAVKDPIT